MSGGGTGFAYGFGLTEIAVLYHLEDVETTDGARLCEWLGCIRDAARRQLNRMARKGVVEVVPGHRLRTYKITGLGRRALRLYEALQQHEDGRRDD